jgi:hypothetical protein
MDLNIEIRVNIYLMKFLNLFHIACFLYDIEMNSVDLVILKHGCDFLLNITKYRLLKYPKL